jgi:phosphoadenosine phosphosulfate reductase
LRYRDHLTGRLGLRDVRTVAPDAARLAAEDPAGRLWRSDPDRCCALRKVEPLARALDGFDAWISGRKRSHGGQRAALPAVETVSGRMKFNPLAEWTGDDVARYFAVHGIPHHPLTAEGYTSIGCRPCTDRTFPGEDPRAGRWRGRAKTECGIHLAPVSR